MGLGLQTDARTQRQGPATIGKCEGQAMLPLWRYLPGWG
jgi:hypothetical protein